MAERDSEDEQCFKEETDALRQLQAQLSELSVKHEKAMEAIDTLNKGSSRSYIYVPRERKIQPFSGDAAKDGRSVDEFIEEVDV